MPRPPVTRRWARLIIPILACLTLVPGGTAYASPADLCAEPLAAVTALRAKIDTHNAKPRTFVLPRQQAAYAAYNAEAQRLNAERIKANSRLIACVEAMKTLEDSAAGSPPLRPATAEDLKDIRDAAKQVPGWQPPNPPAAGKLWRVPRGAPVRPLYEVLRRKTPQHFRNDTFQGERRPAVGSPDPAFPTSYGYTIGGPNVNGLSAVSPDHIIPLAEIVHMRGFVKLTPQNMYQVANARVNLQWLSYKANRTKSSRSAAAMSPVDARWQASQVQLETKVRKQLQDTILTLLRSQG